MGRRIAILLVAVLLGAAGALAQTKPDSPEFDVKEHYTKYEYRIAMRDGVRLFTAVYVPKDSSQAYPFLINRTPYSVAPYGVDQYKKSLGPSDEFQRAGYIFVYQDVRGRYMSKRRRLSSSRPQQKPRTKNVAVDPARASKNNCQKSNTPNTYNRVLLVGDHRHSPSISLT